MKYLVLTILFLGNICSAAIDMRAVHELRFAKSEAQIEEGANFRNITIFVYLKNTGNAEIRVPTDPLATGGYPSKSDPNEFAFCLVWDFVENPLEIDAIVPESRLGISTLRPGETALLKIKTHIDENRYPKISVVYEVQDLFSKRYGLWSGRLIVKSEDSSGLSPSAIPQASGKN